MLPACNVVIVAPAVGIATIEDFVELGRELIDLGGQRIVLYSSSSSTLRGRPARSGTCLIDEYQV